MAPVAVRRRLRVRCWKYYRPTAWPLCHSTPITTTCLILALKDRESINFDLPEALDLALFSRHLECLRRGGPVECPDYISLPIVDGQLAEEIESRPLIVVEGFCLRDSRTARSL
ncbi:MAG: hypothetical protein CM15mP74_09830 [Halieaceae bacterium]|nr:MAG: hypothetical protein CM15mP74_09830 [Halieaceae bacterium]